MVISCYGCLLPKKLSSYFHVRIWHTKNFASVVKDLNLHFPEGKIRVSFKMLFKLSFVTTDNATCSHRLYRG